ncbi:hypothetical protein LZZ85_22910 [Terrimonas sp. NA20]|uniref:Uncharacterized protein n=1 Tax=Terrimonas ginsenosidimutans TaxID=2908004 RepID=A0ABS9KXW5_9BACT|nr:hypothetical protein [Terrimonas ginsenosidimutans]MCG2617165.1 hypothetical protein [Terrimonas ginsenosidimutans]
MTQDTNLHFIRERISELKNAIMYNNSQDVLRVQNNIAEAVEVDKEGVLWFTIKRPAGYMQQCEQVFPARLNFYRKGFDYRVEVSGKATVVNYMYNGHKEDIVLLRMDMNEVEYTEPNAEKAESQIEKYVKQAYSWFLRTFSLEHREQSVFPKVQHSTYE